MGSPPEATRVSKSARRMVSCRAPETAAEVMPAPGGLGLGVGLELGSGLGLGLGLGLALTLNLLGVAREAVEDAARGCGLEEEHGRGEHRGAQPAVQGQG